MSAIEKVIVIVGPTGVGKTEKALRLAKDIGGEIISADSMQVYRGMDVGTAKPTPQEQEQIPHHLIDVAFPKQSFSVATYVELATQAVLDCATRKQHPIIAGGTGLYVDALIDGFLFSDPSTDVDLRQRLIQDWKDDQDSMWTTLQSVDPATAAKLHPNDARRVTRALEVYYRTGRPLSELQREAKPAQPNYRAFWIGLTRDREDLYQRIEQRVDQMLAGGLIQEVQQLLDQYPDQPTAIQALGYKEIAFYLHGHITLDEAVYLLKRDTRRFAKRQLSWLRRRSAIRWWNLSQQSSEDAYDQILHCSLSFLNT